MEKQSSSSEASIWTQPCRLSPGTDAGSPPSFSGPSITFGRGQCVRSHLRGVGAVCSYGQRHVLITQNIHAPALLWGVLHWDPEQFWSSTYLFQQERDSFSLILIQKPVLAEILGADGTFLKDAGPYLPLSSYSEMIFPGPLSRPVQVSSFPYSEAVSSLQGSKAASKPPSPSL